MFEKFETHIILLSSLKEDDKYCTIILFKQNIYVL